MSFINNIAKFAKSLLPSFKKTRMQEDAAVISTTLDTLVLPSFKKAQEAFSGNRKKSSWMEGKEKTFKNYTRDARSKHLFFKIHEALVQASENLETITKVIDSDIEDNVMAQGVGLKTATAIKLLSVYDFTTKYSMVFLNWALVMESRNATGNSDESQFGEPVASELKWVDDNFSAFCKALSVIGGRKEELAAKITKIPDILLNSGTNAFMNTVSQSAVDPLDLFDSGEQSNLVNPIYHVRMIVAEYQNNKYQLLKELKTVLELRLLNLERLGDNNPSAKLQKEVEYTQSRVENLHAKITEYEESLDGS